MTPETRTAALRRGWYPVARTVDLDCPQQATLLGSGAARGLGPGRPPGPPRLPAAGDVARQAPGRVPHRRRTTTRAARPMRASGRRVAPRRAHRRLDRMPIPRVAVARRRRPLRLHSVERTVRAD